MIWITGDTHGDFSRLSPAFFPEGEFMSKDDIVIIAGDFGGYFMSNSQDLRDLDLLASRPFTTCFIDGNHENFPWVNSLPTIEKWGGEVGCVETKNGYIYHLKRGEIYTIEGKTFFTLGGGFSIDKDFRVEGIDWFPEEEIDFKEFEKSILKLEAIDFRVDYIITHAPPVSKLIELGFKSFSLKDDVSVYYLQEILNQMNSFKMWFFGHMHIDRSVDKKFLSLYERVLRII